MQLDLLTYIPTPQEIAEPPPQPKHAIAYHTAAAALYLRLMAKLMRSDRLSQSIRTYEITRLHQLRQQALARIEELEGR